MCLLFLWFQEIHARKCASLVNSVCPRPLLILSVRDEDFHRKTIRGSVNKSGKYAPQDVEAGGTWLSYNHATQRFAIILNNDNPAHPRHNATEKCPRELLSRGILPAMFTDSTITVPSFLEDITKKFDHFNGFSLIFGDTEGCHYVSNRCHDSPVRLEPNVLHAFSNGALSDDPSAWPRLAVGKDVIQSQMPDLRLTTVLTEEEGRQTIHKLVEAFKSNEYVNPDVAMHGSCHERLILPPTSCDVKNHLYGTRTLTALTTFVVEREKSSSDANGDEEVKCYSDHGGDRCGSGVLIVESDFDATAQKWSDKEHVLF